MGLWSFFNKHTSGKNHHNNNVVVKTANKTVEAKKQVEEITSLPELETMLAVESDERTVQHLRRRYNRLCQEKILASSSPDECQNLIDKIDSEEIIGSLISKCRFPEVSAYGAGKIKNPEIIAKLLRMVEGKQIAAILLENPIPEDILRKLTGSVTNNAVRKLVKARYEQNQKTAAAQAQAQVNAEIEPELSISRWKEQIDMFERLCIETEQLKAENTDHATELLNELKIRWSQIEAVPTRFMEILDKRFHKAGEAFLVAIRQQEKEDRLRSEQLQAMDELCGKAEALANAPYDEHVGLQFDALRERWNAMSGIQVIRGPLDERFHAVCETIEKSREIQVQKENETIAELDKYKEELEEAIKSGTIRESAERARTIRQLLHDDIRFEPKYCKAKLGELNNICHRFFVKLKDMYEAAEYDRCTNAVKKEDLCKEAEALLPNEDYYHVSKELKRLHAAWREQGKAHREEEDKLWLRFKTACDELHARCTVFFDRLAEQRQQIMESKKALLDEAINISNNSGEWHTSAERLKEIQKLWREVGFGPREEEQELYRQLREACNSFFDRRKEHYEEVSREWQVNEQHKQELIAEVASLYNMSFKDAVNRLKELRNAWKETGRVSQERERELHEQFDMAVNAYFESIDAAREQNMQLKLQLCEKSEALLTELPDDVNFNDMNHQVEALMTEWKNVGPAPKEKESELWLRFDAPIKSFYEKRREKFIELEASRTANMQAKQQLIDELANIIGNTVNWNENAEKIKAMQHQWKEIGSTFHDKEEELWNNFHGLCDDFFNRRKDFFDQRHAMQDENTRRKLELCVEMEKLAGISAPEETLSHVSLADELAFALQNGGVADLDQQQMMERANNLCDEWRAIGYAGKNDETLYLRFKRACDSFFKHR